MKWRNEITHFGIQGVKVKNFNGFLVIIRFFKFTEIRKRKR